MKTWASRTLVAFLILLGVLVALALAAFLLVRSEWAERRLEGIAMERLGREVDFEGLKILAAWPPQIEIGHLRIANPNWALDPYLIDARGLRATVEAGPLSRGNIVATAGMDEAVAGLEKNGKEVTWDFSKAESPKREGAGASPISLRALSIGELRAVYRDVPEATEVMVRAAGDLGREGRPFQAEASGQVRAEPIRASARAPAVPLAGNQPVQLSFEVSLAKTKTAGQVAMRAAADALQSIQGRVEASGPSVAAWKRITRVDLPSSAPYKVSADFKHEGGVWSVDDLRLTFGKSDVRGSASVDLSRERPFMRARLESSVFDLEETGIRLEAKEELQEPYLFPRQPWPVDALDSLNAEIDLKVKRVRNAEPVPFDALEMRVLLEDSKLRVDPFHISLANGTVSGRAVLDGNVTPEDGSVAIDIRQLQLARLVKAKQKQLALGRLNGRIELSGRGDTMQEQMGSANGRLLFATEGGSASGLLVEVLGLDAAEAATLLGKPKKDLPLRCAVLDLAVKSGTAKVSTFVIDTGDTVLSVEGSLDLGKERISLTARAEPRDVSPFTLRTPVDIAGTFLDPKVEPHAGPLAGRAAAAIGLAAINPLLALIPFVDPGGAPEGGCQPQKPKSRPDK